MNNQDLGLTGASVLALLVALAAVAAALWRTRRIPIAPSREQALERRITELENTVTTMQRLLYDKEQQNGKLLAEITRLTDRVRELERLVPPAAAPARVEQAPTLLAVIGDDEALKIDLAALREVEQDNKMRVSRLYPVTKQRLKMLLDRYRMNGRPIQYVHMAVHSSPEGLAFQGETVTAAWLSENLKSVRVLVINGCRSDVVGDWIGVVPTVVTMREEISHEDAAQFAKLFWTAVANGVAPDEAYYQARDRAPQSVAEFVELN